MSRSEPRKWYPLALIGLTLAALTHWIPLVLGDHDSVTFYDSALIPLLLLGLGISRPSGSTHLRAALLLLLFPISAMLPLLLPSGPAQIWSESPWPTLSVAVAFAFYLTLASPYCAAAPDYLKTDTRGLERFELGQHAKRTRRPQRLYLVLSFVLLWCLAVPSALGIDTVDLTATWGELATEVRIFAQILALALAVFVLIVFVAPSTRTKPPSRRVLRVRVYRSLGFAAAALGALLLWSLR